MHSQTSVLGAVAAGSCSEDRVRASLAHVQDFGVQTSVLRKVIGSTFPSFVLKDWQRWRNNAKMVQCKGLTVGFDI